MEKVEQNPGRTGGEMNFLHRIDFIPLKPTEPSTILRLLSFQNVEGLVRHRKLGVRVGSEENTYLSIQEEAFLQSPRSNKSPFVIERINGKVLHYFKTRISEGKGC